MRRKKRWFPILVGGLVLLCLLVAGVSALSNRTLPSGPRVMDRMDPLDQSRLNEALRVKQTLGESIWPGWGKADIPVILWNPEYSFLVGMDGAPPGWEAVPGDTFSGQVYFRRPSDNPQNFAVRVGDGWAGSMATKAHTDNFLIGKFREMFPPLVKEIFPYRVLILPSEVQITGVLHETFHAYQETIAPQRVAQGEQSQRDESVYWQADAAMRADWKQEIDLLARALQAGTDEEAAGLTRQFLDQRDLRRKTHSLTGQQIDMERSIEWEEGLAKYVEIQAWRLASTMAGYTPVLDSEQDPDFKRYRTFATRWKQEIDQMRRQAGEESAIRFYYTGMAQGMLLDRFAPGWKTKALEEGFWLEDALAAALG